MSVVGPDFICIGMPKAGTGWLFDQFAAHPDFWMPPIKEVHYLRRGAPIMRHVKVRLERWDKVSDPSRTGTGRKRRLDERDRQFLLEAAASAKKPVSLRTYASFFRYKADKLSGDITPQYSALGGDVIQQVAKELPETKIILLIRDPVSRALSCISMAGRKGQFNKTALDDAASFKAVLASAPYMKNRSKPTVIVNNWRQYAPNVSLRYFFYDDLIARERELRREILTYLGADWSKAPAQNTEGENRKSKQPKLPFTDMHKQIAIDHFRDELKACKDLGGPAETWAAQYGL